MRLIVRIENGSVIISFKSFFEDRILMTLVVRIKTDPCLSAQSVKSVFYPFLGTVIICSIR